MISHHRSETHRHIGELVVGELRALPKVSGMAQGEEADSEPPRSAAPFGQQHNSTAQNISGKMAGGWEGGWAGGWLVG